MLFLETIILPHDLDGALSDLFSQHQLLLLSSSSKDGSLMVIWREILIFYAAKNVA